MRTSGDFSIALKVYTHMQQDGRQVDEFIQSKY